MATWSWIGAAKAKHRCYAPSFKYETSISKFQPRSESLIRLLHMGPMGVACFGLHRLLGFLSHASLPEPGVLRAHESASPRWTEFGSHGWFVTLFALIYIHK